MKTHTIPTPGAFFEARYPFVRKEYYEDSCWRPGCRTEIYGSDDVTFLADGEGSIILTVVSVHKPGRFPCRVFFTRRWRDPKGREFGKGKLHCTTVNAFYGLTKGYRYAYEMAQPSVTHEAAE